jgi:hypothetical protein
MADKKPQQQKTYKEAAGEYYNQKYETWMPWIEDQYLKWFTKDNKASYATKRSSSLLHIPRLSPSIHPTSSSPHPLTPSQENLDKTKVTGVSQVDNLQDGVNGLVSGQVGKGGLAQPIGDAFSKEGINRAERGGKDDSGKPIEGQGPLGGYGQSAAEGVKGSVGSVAGGAQSAGQGVVGGAKNAGGWVGGMFGGKKGEGQGEQKK